MFIRSFVFILGQVVILFAISWELTLAMLASILPVILFSIVYGKAMKSVQKIIQDKKADISTLAEESFSNVRTVKAFATEKEESSKFLAGNRVVYHQGYIKALWYGAFNFVAQLFVFGSMVVIIYLGAHLYLDGKISLGEITAFFLQMMQLLINFMVLASVLGSVMSVSI